MENINKSIIYGNIHQNSYGKFLPICSPINDRTNVTSILEYINQSVHFKKYNRIAYAYRVEQVPIVFITQKKNVDLQYYEEYHSDQTIEGSGQKLLHLLEKFNVKNVLIACLIQQFNPLLPFQTTNYRAIVQNSRILLDELYKKVLNLKEKAEQGKNSNNQFLKDNKTIKLKQCNISQGIDLEKILPEKPILLVKQRPNHIYTTIKPSFIGSVTGKNSNLSSTYEIKFMWQRCKSMRQQFTQLKQSLTEKQIEQFRYFVMYDKNPTINLVIKLLTIYEGVTKDYLLKQYQFQNVKKIDFEVLTGDRLKAMDDILKSHKKLSVDSILKTNRAMGMLFSMLELKIKFTKTFNRITQIMQKNSITEDEIQEIDQNSAFGNNNISSKASNSKLSNLQ